MKPKHLSPYKLPPESLSWAIHHIHSFGDTDILPVPVEYKAIFADSCSVSNALSRIDMSEYRPQVPRRLAVPKAIGGFRMASQLDPADAILFTALAQNLANEVEASRIEPADCCSQQVLWGVRPRRSNCNVSGKGRYKAGQAGHVFVVGEASIPDRGSRRRNRGRGGIELLVDHFPAQQVIEFEI